MLARGIVSRVEIALRDDRSEACERTFPKADAVHPSGRVGSSSDPPGFLATDAAIDPDGSKFFAELVNQLGFEIATDAFGVVFAHAQADSGARRVSLHWYGIGRDVCFSGFAEHVFQPALRQLCKIICGVCGPAGEMEIVMGLANRHQAELRHA